MKRSDGRQVLVSYVALAGAADEEYGCLHARLTFEEQSRASHYQRLQDRLAFAAGRALVRAMLTRLSPMPPQGWIFLPGPAGKPRLVSGSDRLEFNISHTAGMVAAVATVEGQVGVDIEYATSDLSLLDIARDRFATSEQALLNSLPDSSRRDTFLSLWTLHEAYAKALGKGLSKEMSQAAFDLDPPRLSSTSDNNEETRSWAFRLLRPAPDYFLAVAASKQTTEEPMFSVEPTELRNLL